ncbi:MAG: CvpA family protein [Gallintestinimicrobium sp.]
MINLLEAAVVAVMVLFAIAGFRKGFVKKFAAMVSLALSIVLVSALLPYITQYLKENTPVYTFLVEQCTGIMEKQVLNSLTVREAEPERIRIFHAYANGRMRSERFSRTV